MATMTSHARAVAVGGARSVLAVALATAGLLWFTAGSASAVPIDVPCTFDKTADPIWVLTTNCATLAPLEVPDGITIDGANLTISATDAGGAQWNGAIVTNAVGATTMNIQNVRVTGPDLGFQLCAGAGADFVLYGIYFNDASGTVNNVTVDNIFQQQNGLFASCQTGRAIRSDGVSPGRTLTITGTTVTDYQKSGFEARGTTNLSLSGSTAGPPRPLEGLSAQNAVSLVGVTAGTVTGNTIHGSSDQAPFPGCGNCAPAAGTGVLLSNADNVTVNENTLVGNGTDIGIAVSAGSTGNTISFNDVTRTPSLNPDNIDGEGVGISVDPPPDNSATLICNTFSGWNTNIQGAIQIGCTPLPPGTECQPYSAALPAVEGGTAPFIWSVLSGTLPPGLTLAADGTITGTPTLAGEYNFDAQVADSSEVPFTASQAQAITVAPPNCVLPTTTTVAPTTTTTTTVPPTTTTTTAQTAALSATESDDLPFTGMGLGLAVLGSAFLVGGLALGFARTRRRR
jgi:hypothetical protein